MYSNAIIKDNFEVLLLCVFLFKAMLYTPTFQKLNEAKCFSPVYLKNVFASKITILFLKTYDTCINVIHFYRIVKNKLYLNVKIRYTILYFWKTI